MLGPQGCECPEPHHAKHRGSSCLAVENLFPIARKADQRRVVHWVCDSCYRELCLASPGKSDFIPLGNLAA